MNPHCSRRGNRALTLFEVVVAVAVVAVLAALAVLLIPVFSPSSHHHGGPSCVNNLKQIGLAFRVWSEDNNDKYPMGVSVTNGGAMESAATGNVLAIFLTMTNELSTSKILVCPEDREHIGSTIFDAAFSAKNISYFLNPDVGEMDPQKILSGDDNLTIGGVPVNSGLSELPTHTPIAWTDKRHRKCGYIGLADGSAQLVSNPALQQTFQPGGTNSIRLAIP